MSEIKEDDIINGAAAVSPSEKPNNKRRVRNHNKRAVNVSPSSKPRRGRSHSPTTETTEGPVVGGEEESGSSPATTPKGRIPRARKREKLPANPDRGTSPKQSTTLPTSNTSATAKCDKTPVSPRRETSEDEGDDVSPIKPLRPPRRSDKRRERSLDTSSEHQKPRMQQPKSLSENDRKSSTASANSKKSTSTTRSNRPRNKHRSLSPTRSRSNNDGIPSTAINKQRRALSPPPRIPPNRKTNNSKNKSFGPPPPSMEFSSEITDDEDESTGYISPKNKSSTTGLQLDISKMNKTMKSNSDNVLPVFSILDDDNNSLLDGESDTDKARGGTTTETENNRSNRSIKSQDSKKDNNLAIQFRPWSFDIKGKQCNEQNNNYDDDDHHNHLQLSPKGNKSPLGLRKAVKAFKYNKPSMSGATQLVGKLSTGFQQRLGITPNHQQMKDDDDENDDDEGGDGLTSLL